MQLAAAHGVERQLHAGDGPAGQLPRGDHTALQRVRGGAQRYGGVLLRQAVVGVLRHAQGNFHPDVPGDDAHAVAKKDVLKEPVLPVLLRIGAVDEVHLERHRGQVAAVFIFRLGGLAQFGVALILAFRRIAVRHFPGLAYRQMNPLRMRVRADVRAVDVQFRQVEDVAVRVLAGGHDARDHVCLVHVVGDAGEVLALPNLYVAVHAHAPDQKHVKPVPRQLPAVLLRQPAFAQQGLHGIDVLKAHVLRRGGQVGIEGEAMPGEAGGGKALHDGSPHRGGRGPEGFDHVVQKVIEDMAGVDRDLA